ncbi:MAG: HAMP domain-containing protein [Candidatus Thermoplasmatota archaeon]|nr:HAMP domain-containing protein [Candidatus Thermoplasmatota archaeon]
MKVNLSLSLKLTLIVFVVSGVILFSLTYTNIREQAQFFENAYTDKAIALAQSLDASITSRSDLEETKTLGDSILKFIYSNDDALSISINRPNSSGVLTVFLSSDKELTGTIASAENIRTYETGEVTNIPLHVGDKHTLTVVTPIKLAGQIVGTYEMQLSMNNAYATLDARVTNMIMMAALWLFVAIVSFLILLRRIVVKPITTIRNAANDIARGDLNTRISLKSRDELGDLASSFNHMSVELQQSQAEIKRYSEGLEQQVADRTKELATSEKELKQKVDALERNKKAMMNIMWDLKNTISKLEEAEAQIKDQNIELKDAQKKLHALNKNLEKKVKERTAEVEKLLKQKDEFIGQLGHDLKNPLTPLVGLLPILEEREKDPNVKEHFRVVLRNVDYMRDIVFKTLQLARLRSPNTQFDIKDINLRQEVDNVIGNQILFFQENNMHVENNIDHAVMVKADQLRLDELMNNLFTNAVKYSPKDGGTITIDAEKTKGVATVSIKDTGLGMTEEQLSHIFDEFYKADKSRHDMDSSGLGLAICKRIVEKHGGKIWAESKGPGKGSIFYFTLKLSTKSVMKKEVESS